MSRTAFLIPAAAFACAAAMPGSSAAPAPRFYRGMIHAHTCWSDGRALPEQAVAAYRDAGYDFFAITDHNRIGVDPDRWIEVAPPKVGVWPPKSLEPSVFEAYRAAFPDAEWRTTADGKTEVRMRTFAETAARFNVPGRFLVMPGCEVTVATHDASGVRRDIHMNYVGLDALVPRAEKAYLIEWAKDTTISKTIRETKDEFGALAAAKGNPPSLFWVNHPHWQYYDVLPQDIIDHPDIRFFEVCNTGGEWPAADTLPHDGLSNDRLWDVVNATRCQRGEPLLYGLATEDTHYYPGSGTSHLSFIGDGWIGVRAEELTPAALFAAMERGDFYAASGIDFEDVRFDAETGALSVAVPAKPGVAYTVNFITTKRGAPLEPVEFVDVPSPTSAQNVPRHIPVYSPQIGAVVKTVAFGKGEAVRASYALAPDDLYVRARVEADEPAVYPNPERHLHPLVKMAWTQPYQAFVTRNSSLVTGADASGVCAYTPDVAARPQARGTMLSQFAVTEDDFRTLREWGATVARYQMYPVGEEWKVKTGTPEGFAAWLDWKLEVLTREVLPLARKYGIPLVVDLHVPPGGRGGSGMKMLDVPEWADFFVECWRRIATACAPAVQTAPGCAPACAPAVQTAPGCAPACAPAVQTAGIWAYDLITEPTQFSAPAYCDYLEVQRRAAGAIRAIDPVTPVIVSCNAGDDGAWCSPSAFRDMEPLDLVNVLYQFHLYQPFEYTHQKVLPQFKETAARWPDPAKGWDAAWLRRAVEPVREFQRRTGARIFVGEFSAVSWAEGCDRWIVDASALLNGLGWDWCYHAFREWPGWSVEHDPVNHGGASAADFAPSADNPRKRALLEGLSDGDARRIGAGMMNPGPAISTCAEQSAPGRFKVLIYGNSMAVHDPKPDIGWTNNCGMAASAPENDFAHLVVAGLEAHRGGKADFRIRNVAGLERNFTTNVASVAMIAEDVAWAPDYVVIAVGENAPDIHAGNAAAYRRFLADLARPFAESPHPPAIVMRAPFWNNPAKAECTAMAAMDVGAAFVDAGPLGLAEENKAIGKFDHAGVANHPGDLGMKRMADLILQAFDESPPE